MAGPLVRAPVPRQRGRSFGAARRLPRRRVGQNGRAFVAYPISYPTPVAKAESLNRHGQFVGHAAYSKTVSGGFPLTRVRIPPPPFFRELLAMCTCFAGDAGRCKRSAWSLTDASTSVNGCQREPKALRNLDFHSPSHSPGRAAGKEPDAGRRYPSGEEARASGGFDGWPLRA